MKKFTNKQQIVLLNNAFAIIVILISVACCIQSSTLRAQSNRPHKSPIHYSGQLGVGFYPDGLSGTGSVNVIFNKNQLSFRAIRAGEVSIIGGGVNENLWEFALLYGRSIRNQKSLYGGSAGLAYVRGVKQGGVSYQGWFGNVYESVPFDGVGFAMEGQIFWMPSSNFALGLVPQLNFNKHYSYFGFLFAIRLGHMPY